MATGDMMERMLDILTLLADQPQGLPISEVSRQLDLPKSGVHRLLSVLVRRGLATQDEDAAASVARAGEQPVDGGALALAPVHHARILGP